MVDKALSPATLTLISNAGLTNQLVWQVGSTDVSNVEQVDYLENNGLTVGATIRNAIDNDPDYICPPNERDSSKRSWSFSVARNGTNQPDQYLRRQNGTSTFDCPYRVPFDCTIYAATAEHNPNEPDTDSWDFIVEVNGVGVYTLNVPTNADFATETDLFINISQGDAIRMRMANQTQTINHPGGSIFLIEI